MSFPRIDTSSLGTREVVRRLAVGAEPQTFGGVHFRVWAPTARRVRVRFERPVIETLELTREDPGYFGGYCPGARAGSLYRYVLDDAEKGFPDPASHFQPFGPEGPSEVIDAGAYRWSDLSWRGAGIRGQVLYEIHVGTFTPKGDWTAAEERLPYLAELGVTVLEIMPIAEFPGRFGWGYDGVCLFAPTRLYGRPNDLRRFVDTAQSLGLAVILDVVYNHLGPDGNGLAHFSPHYFSPDRMTDWGQAINFDGAGSEGVREFYLANAEYWISEFHFDGLRMDATQDIHDTSREHILTSVTRRVRAAAGGRATIVVAENESQQAQLARPEEQNGFGIDALWNDDFHHSAMVALSGRNEAYYTDYYGGAQELLSAVKWGFLYQGQRYKWQRARRGKPALDLGPWAFITFLQNHDQIANSASGKRCHELGSPARYRALTALLLLSPGTPMLFQGQEFAASSPFLYFADHRPGLSQVVEEGRREFLKQFRSLALPEVQDRLSGPMAVETFERSKLDWSEVERHAAFYRMHKDLVRLRHEDPVLRLQEKRGIDGAVLSPYTFVVRFFAPDGKDRLLTVNLGRDLHLDPAPEPLLAPPEGRVWSLRWSSEDVRYGGTGTPPLDTEENWRIPGESAVLLVPAPPGRANS